ncbi:hypothetical protein ACU686_45280 [Yinghuangia aomiensis]
MAAMATRATRPAPDWERQVDDVPAALAVSGGLCVVACARGGVHLLDVVTGQAIAKLRLPGGRRTASGSRRTVRWPRSLGRAGTRCGGWPTARC